MTEVIMGGWLSIPLSSLSTDSIELIKSELTYVSKFTDDNGKRKQILLYDIDGEFIHTPREWARHNIRRFVDDEITCQYEWIDEPVEPFYSRLPDPNHPKVLDPIQQKKFMDDLEHAVIKKKNVLAVAMTGAGKTAVSLYVAAKLNRKILILVNKNVLRDQWIDEIQNHLGIPSEMIATIQGPKCKLDGKVIAVGLLQSFARREYPKEVYEFASVVIVDECHNLSTEFFGKVISKIKAKYRILLSATPTRKDGSDVVLYYHCGNPRVTSANRSMDIDVIVKTFTPDSMWGDTDRTQLFHLTRLKKRNQYLTDIISGLYKNNRKILAISHSVDHLDKIYAMLMTANINPDDVGYFTGSVNDSGQRRISTKEERDVAKSKRIILATYGAFKEGVDVPDLDAGIDLSPNYKGNQVIGRIRRYVPGKRKPKWITIFDDKSLTALKMFQSRIKEYKQAGANIVYE